MIAVILMLTALSMLACYQVAKARSADAHFWLLMALIFGPLAIPFAFLSKPTQS